MKKLVSTIKESITSAFRVSIDDAPLTKYQLENATKNYVASVFKTLILVTFLFIIAQIYYLIYDIANMNFSGEKIYNERYILDFIGEVLLLSSSVITLLVVTFALSNEKKGNFDFQKKVIIFYYLTVTIGCCLFIVSKILRFGGIVNTHSSIIYIILLLVVSPSHSKKVNWTCIIFLMLSVVIPGILVLNNPSIVSQQENLVVDELENAGWIVNNMIFIIFGAVVAMYSHATTMRSKMKSVVLQDRNAELKLRTETDELTQVSNRRAMKMYIESKEDEWRETQEGVAFLMLDIDFFKKFNDFYGHLRGDECLRRVAQAANLAAQQYNGNVYRYGGEEFVIIAENIDENGALSLCKEVHREIGKLKISHEGINGDKETMITVSIGLNYETSFKRASSQWILDADLQLYYAKHEGRNCTAFRNGLYNTYHRPAKGEEAKMETQ